MRNCTTPGCTRAALYFNTVYWTGLGTYGPNAKCATCSATNVETAEAMGDGVHLDVEPIPNRYNQPNMHRETLGFGS